MADIFSTDNVGNEDNLDLGLNDLVGEGKKYKTPDELAKAYANIERHTRTIEGENAEIRAKLDLLEANPPKKDDDGGEPPRQDDQSSPAPNNTPKPNEVDFRSQIRDEVKALNEAERARANVESSASEMIKHFGDAAKANEAVIRRAGELGVSVDWLKDSASRSPAAFLATMGITGQPSHSTPASPGTGHRDSTNSSAMKNFAYYDKIRKENPKVYFSAATQTEMMNQARALGSDFYKH